jgi:hypothetical protein
MGSGLYTIELYDSFDVLIGDTQQVLSYNAVLFANLYAGTYKVVVIDNQCGFKDYVTINEPQLLTASITDTTGITCIGKYRWYSNSNRLAVEQLLMILYERFSQIIL